MKRIRIQRTPRLARWSVGTVDRALHGRKEISEDTRKRILQIAREHKYRPNFAARALSVGKATIRIGLCLPREVHYFFDEVREGFLTEARRYRDLGVEVIYRPFERLGVGERETMAELVRGRPQALAICPGQPRESCAADQSCGRAPYPRDLREHRRSGHGPLCSSLG